MSELFTEIVPLGLAYGFIIGFIAFFLGYAVKKSLEIFSA